MINYDSGADFVFVQIMIYAKRVSHHQMIAESTASHTHSGPSPNPVRKTSTWLPSCRGKTSKARSHITGSRAMYAIRETSQEPGSSVWIAEVGLLSVLSSSPLTYFVWCRFRSLQRMHVHSNFPGKTFSRPLFLPD